MQKLFLPDVGLHLCRINSDMFVLLSEKAQRWWRWWNTTSEVVARQRDRFRHSSNAQMLCKCTDSQTAIQPFRFRWNFPISETVFTVRQVFTVTIANIMWSYMCCIRI